MNRITNHKKDRATRELVIGKCWDFFNDNFHKFSQTNKIKIGLSLCTRDMPVNPLIDQSIHNHYVVFRNPEALKEDAGIEPRTEAKGTLLKL